LLVQPNRSVWHANTPYLSLDRGFDGSQTTRQNGTSALGEPSCHGGAGPASRFSTRRVSASSRLSSFTALQLWLHSRLLACASIVLGSFNSAHRCASDGVQQWCARERVVVSVNCKRCLQCVLMPFRDPYFHPLLHVQPAWCSVEERKYSKWPSECRWAACAGRCCSHTIEHAVTTESQSDCMLESVPHHTSTLLPDCCATCHLA